MATIKNIKVGDTTYNIEVSYIDLADNGATQTSTSGTITNEQLTVLQSSKQNCIIFNNQIYRLQDNEHNSGILTYTYNGHDSNIVSKTITVTISTLAWALTTIDFSNKQDTITSDTTLTLGSISAPDSSESSTYGTGTSGQVLKSNGNGGLYWADDNNTNRTISVNGSTVNALSNTTTPVNFKAGDNVTLTASGADITIAATGGGGGTEVVANNGETTSATLNTLKVGNTNYSVPQGGGGSGGLNVVEITDFGSDFNINTAEAQEIEITEERYNQIINANLLKAKDKYGYAYFNLCAYESGMAHVYINQSFNTNSNNNTATYKEFVFALINTAGVYMLAFDKTTFTAATGGGLNVVEITEFPSADFHTETELQVDINEQRYNQIISADFVKVVATINNNRTELFLSKSLTDGNGTITYFGDTTLNMVQGGTYEILGYNIMAISTGGSYRLMFFATIKSLT